jgi:hypothetical protein
LRRNLRRNDCLKFRGDREPLRGLYDRWSLFVKLGNAGGLGKRGFRGSDPLRGGGARKRTGQSLGRAAGLVIQQTVELARQGPAHQSLEFGVQTLVPAGRQSALDVVEELVHTLYQLLGGYASPFAGGVAFGEHPFQPPGARAPLPRVLGRLADDAEQFHFPIGLALREFLGKFRIVLSGVADRAFGATDAPSGTAHAEALAHQAHDFAFHGFVETRGSADGLHG